MNTVMADVIQRVKGSYCCLSAHTTMITAMQLTRYFIKQEAKRWRQNTALVYGSQHSVNIQQLLLCRLVVPNRVMRTFISSDGLCIRVGENAAENEQLCKQARQNDLWFHLDGQASPHAVLTTNGAKPAAVRRSIHECQQLVKHFSSARWGTSASKIVNLDPFLVRKLVLY